jgi:hypothetical protein
MQEASGNPADSIGSFTLTAASTPTYQQAVAGWTRVGILFDNVSADALTTASASLPNLTSASQMVLAIVRMPTAAPAAARAVVSIGGSGTRFVAQVNATPRLEARHSANVATGTANAADSAVHPIVLRHNDTASEADLCTDAEKLSPTWSASVAGQGVLFGNAGADTIVLASCALYQLTDCTSAGNSNDNTGGDLDIDDGGLTISGNGSTIEQTCSDERVLHSNTDDPLTLDGLTITGGDEDDDMMDEDHEPAGLHHPGHLHEHDDEELDDDADFENDVEDDPVVEDCSCTGDEDQESGHAISCLRWRPKGWNELTADERGEWEDQRGF